MSWPVFLGVAAVLLVFAFLVWLGGRSDERRWKAARDADDAAHHSAE